MLFEIVAFKSTVTFETRVRVCKVIGIGNDTIR